MTPTRTPTKSVHFESAGLLQTEAIVSSSRATTQLKSSVLPETEEGREQKICLRESEEASRPPPISKSRAEVRDQGSVQAQALTATPIQVSLSAGQVASPPRIQQLFRFQTLLVLLGAHPKTSSIEALSLAMFECFKSHVKRRKRCELRGTGEQCLDTLGNGGLVETRHKELLRQIQDSSSLIRGTKQMIGEDLNEAQQVYKVYSKTTLLASNWRGLERRLTKAVTSTKAGRLCE